MVPHVSANRISLGLLGLGNVGSGVAKLLEDNRAAVSARLGAEVTIKRALVRNPDKERPVALPADSLVRDPDAILEDPEIDIVVELIGGQEPALDYVLRAFRAGKHVVTANKLLLATSAEILIKAAEAARVNLFYEASVCGGVPVLRALREGLASDRVDEIIGIVNGTSNYILTRMTEERKPFAELLKNAQSLGYAEADPTLDVGGGDASHKLAVMVALCFGARSALPYIYKEGISHVDPIDIQYADRFGFKIKPLAIAREVEGRLEARVHPTLVPKRWLLASVDGVFNAVYVSSYALGHSMYYGRGAGMMPTAVAVVSDVIECCRDILGDIQSPQGRPFQHGPFGPSKTWSFRDIAEISSRYYLRFSVDDQPGVLAQIAGFLGKGGISISEMVQSNDPPDEPGSATVVLTTHEAKEGAVRKALAEIDSLPVVRRPTCLLRMMG